MDDSLTAYLMPLTKVATKLNTVKVVKGEDLSVVGSHFGGQPYAEAGEDWPICPKCESALTFICQIDTATGFHEQPRGIALFTFFYCWKCGAWGLDDEPPGAWIVRTYSEPEKSKAVLTTPRGEQSFPPNVCSVIPEKINSFPDWDEADCHLTKEAADIRSYYFSQYDEPWETYEAVVRSLGGETDFCTFVGGYPKWVQGETILTCDQCQSRMKLLVQIDSDGVADIMWGDSGCVYLFHCHDHPKNVKLHLQCF